MFPLARNRQLEREKLGSQDTQQRSHGWAYGKAPPLVAHIIFRLGTGGLENGLVNLINHMPPERYRHVIICLKGYDAFSRRIRAQEVKIIDLQKRDGKSAGTYLLAWRLLRRLRPDIVHLRNLGTVDFAWVARMAGVPRVIQGEHGWDTLDLFGTSRKYRLLRRACRPCVSRYITVSRDLATWLAGSVGVSTSRITHICNGVDTWRFRPQSRSRSQELLGPVPDDTLIVGWVGRMADVKAPLNLVDAFARLVDRRPNAKLRLLMVGDGPLMPQVRTRLAETMLDDVVWLPGTQENVSEWLRAMDIFALPSLNEGISNTVLEAMATGLPVIATRVGGNSELVADGETGMLVAPDNVEALCSALQCYVDDPNLIDVQGVAARRRAEQHFSLQTMVDAYVRVYDELLGTLDCRAEPRRG